MFNTGFRGKRASDGTGIINSQEQFVQNKYPVPTITSWSISGTDDTALNTAGGQTVLVNGGGFVAGCAVTVNGVTITPVTVISPNQISFTSTALAGGSYTLIVYNSEGGGAILVPGLVYSSVPTYTTAAGSVGSGYETTSISTSVVATSDSSLTYAVTSGALPSGASMTSGGVITGTYPVLSSGSSETFYFDITATDAESQDVTRSFTLTTNIDVVTWVTPSSGATITNDGSAYLQALSATDAAGYAVSYTANALPTGLTLSSGTISGTPTDEGTTTTLLTATAATTNRTGTNTITWVVTLGDSYWKNVSLLLSGSTPTTTFINDASLNNNQLTIAGDTRPSLFTPYAGSYYSNYFDGTGDYLTVSSFSGLGSTGAFTIEFYWYPTILGRAYVLLDYSFRSTTFSMVTDYMGATATTFYIYVAGTQTHAHDVTQPLLNKWNHVALVRNSSNLVTLYVNGIAQAGYGLSPSGPVGANTLYIGGANTALPSAGYDYQAGYVSNLRAVSGTAVYTAAFTPPTTPLTAVSGTQLLTCQSPRLVDNSTNNFAITKNGDTTVSSAYPFPTPTTSSYNTQYSTYFDGTGDYLTLASAITYTGDFTIEAWIFNSNSSITNYAGVVGGASGAFVPMYVYANKMECGIWGSSGIVTSTGTITPGQWNHVALVRSGSTMRWYINGTQDSATATNSSTLTQNSPSIGSSPSVAWTGYISNVRITKGVAVYTGNFTVPTSPIAATQNAGTNISAITGTSTYLLTCQNSTLIDNSTNAFAITSNGQAQPIAVSPFTMTTSTNTLTSLGSAYFDGTSDVLTLAAGKFPTIGTSDFTMEAWVYTTTIAAGASGIFDMWNGGTTAFLLRRNSGDIQFYVQGGSNIGVTAMVANTWTHLAIVKSGTTITLYKDGVSIGIPITSYSTSITSTAALGIGGTATSGSECWNGYISNARIVVGTALYTSNFLPPQAPLTAVANTQLLTCQYNGGANNNGFVDQSSFNNIITRAGNTTQGTFSPYSQNGWSTYFPSGANNNLYAGDGSAALVDIAGAYTLEGWFFLLTAPTQTAGIMCTSLSNASAGNVKYWGWGGANTFEFYNRSGATLLTITCSQSWPVNTWFHMAFVMNSTTTATIYLNGTSVGSTTDSSTFSGTTAYDLCIGSYTGAGTYYFSGYMSNLRFSNIARYSSSFTPSTTPLVADVYTTVLTCNSVRFVNQSGYATTAANTNFTSKLGTHSIQAYSPFGGVTSVPTSYSNYFDGTGDYLSIADNAALELGNGSFTIESWVNFSSLPSTNGYQATIISKWAASNNSYELYLYNNAGTYQIYLTYSTTGTDAINLGVNWTPTVGIWYHVACVRSGSNLYFFVNGTQQGATQTLSATIFDGTAGIQIGSFLAGANYYLNGYLSNLRIVKGTALYTSEFTPSTTPLTTTSQGATATQVSLLTCQNNTIIDNSPNYFAITATGDVNPKPFNPFGLTNTTRVSYTPSVNGGSMYFDGTGDYLATTATQVIPATTTYTLEAWVYPTGSYAAVETIVSQGTIGNAARITMYLDATTGILRLQTGATNINTSTAIPLNTWTHVAFVNNAGSYKAFVNGVSVASGSNAIVPQTTAFSIGGFGASTTEPFLGYMSDVRVTAAALYASNFYPGPAPATPTTTIGATTYASNLLLNGTSGGIIDYHSTNDLETVGNTQLAPQDPYGGSYYSNYFDGASDGLLTSSGFAIGAGDFTVEFWVNYTDTTTDTNDRRIISQGSSGSITALNISTLPSVTTIGGVSQPAGSIYLGGSNYWIGTNLAVNDGIWHHIAFARQTGTTRCFVDGVLKQTVSTSYTLSTSTAYTIGYYITGGISTGNWSGYISNLRVVVGTSLYNSAFTAPTIPLTAISNTQLLTCQSNKFIDNSTNGFGITPAGDVAVKTFNPFQQNTGKSLYFDGTGDYLTQPYNYINDWWKGDFTIEAWVYPITLTGWSVTNTNNIPCMIMNGTYNSNSNYWNFGPLTDGTVRFYYWTGVQNVVTSTVTVKAGQWNHIAMTKTSAGIRIWVNGIGTTATAISGTPQSSATYPLVIGAYYNTYINGYVDDLRITPGIARYTTTFTPSTIPLKSS